LGDRGDPEDLDPFDQFCLSRLAQRDNDPREAGLLSRQSRRQDAANRPQATVQTKLTQQDCAARLLGSEVASTAVTIPRSKFSF
jgi:hypothetical protein